MEDMPLSWWNMLGGLFRTPCHEVGDQPRADDFAERLEFLSFSDPFPFMSNFSRDFSICPNMKYGKKMEQPYFGKVLKKQSIFVFGNILKNVICQEGGTFFPLFEHLSQYMQQRIEKVFRPTFQKIERQVPDHHRFHFIKGNTARLNSAIVNLVAVRIEEYLSTFNCQC